METSTIITIVNIVLSIATVAGLGTIIPMFVKDRLDNKRRALEEQSESARQARLEELRNVVREEIAQVKNDVVQLVDDSAITKKGLQAALRHDLYEIARQARKDGYCSDETKYDFNSMYEQYHNLGKNGVMDTIKDEIMALPSEPPKHKKSKELLHE